MTRLRATLAVLALAAGVSLRAQTDSGVATIEGSDAVFVNNVATFTNGVVARGHGAVLIADSGSVDMKTGDATVSGNVRIQRGDLLWTGDHVRFNFRTGQIEAEQFRTGKAPVFAGGRGLQGEGLIRGAVQSYTATNGFVTTDDVQDPAIRLEARRLHIIPGERIEAAHAILYLYGVPIFYFPYYSRNLAARANHFDVEPGYRTSYGAFALGDYTWFLNPQLDGVVHVDYRQKRGPGAGPDVNFHLGRWGEGTARYYYTYDDKPRTNPAVASPVSDHNRQLVSLAYQAAPFTNSELLSAVRYATDPGVLRDFFEAEYRKNPQPYTFLEARKFWSNFSVDIMARPRLEKYYEAVERLPDVRVTGFRQQIGPLPLFYQSESSAGYYRRRFAETNGAPSAPDYEAARADTYHELLLPRTFFGWLNVTPHAGGRFTWYSEAGGPGGVTDETGRGVFDTGVEVGWKTSRLWPGVHNRLLELDGLRHILEPSADYAYVPRPAERPPKLPQFDYPLPSLRLLPVRFPEYNSIDAIDGRNVLRLGLRNKLQTKRRGEVQDVVDWEVMGDWNLHPRGREGTAGPERTFGDIYSDLELMPRSWMTLQSQTRWDTRSGLRMALHTVTIEPNEVWSWTIGHFYLRGASTNSLEDWTRWGPGTSEMISSLYYRLNENWGLRADHTVDASEPRLREQYYTVYRDFRSWTAALTAGRRSETATDPAEYTVAFKFSIKATPKYGLGRDTVRWHSMLGRY